MQTQLKIQDSLGVSPSFNCYSSDSLTTSKAVDKVIREFEEGDDFEFSLVFSDEKEADDIQEKWTVFNRDLLLNEELIPKDGSVSITSSLGNLFIDDQEESSSYSSSEVDELENIPSGTFCVWKPNPKCKKSSSTGSSGSKKWKIRYSFKRSNSEGKEPMVLLPSNNNKIDTSPKLKRNSNKFIKAQTPVHELFYVQRRAENEMGRKKSYLPYRKDMFGLFANVNGMGKMLPF